MDCLGNRRVLPTFAATAAGVRVRKYEKTAPKLAAGMKDNVRASFAIFRVSAAHSVRLRTTNMLERVNCELKRRTHVATVFLNDAALLR